MKYQSKSKFTLLQSLHWSIPEKNQTRQGGGGEGVQDMDFPGGCGISRGDQEKVIWNFQESWFLVLEFPRDVTQFFTISSGGALICLEFPGVKQIN